MAICGLTLLIFVPATCGQDVKDAKGSKDEDLAFAKEAGENHNPQEQYGDK